MGEEYPSPDNRYVLILGCNEYRMSHWVCSPLLKDNSDGGTIFSAEGGYWRRGRAEEGELSWQSNQKDPSHSPKNCSRNPSIYRCRSSARRRPVAVCMRSFSRRSFS